MDWMVHCGAPTRLAALLPCRHSEGLSSAALRLLHNLSFDTNARVEMLRAGLVPKVGVRQQRRCRQRRCYAPVGCLWLLEPTGDTVGCLWVREPTGDMEARVQGVPRLMVRHMAAAQQALCAEAASGVAAAVHGVRGKG